MTQTKPEIMDALVEAKMMVAGLVVERNRAREERDAACETVLRLSKQLDQAQAMLLRCQAGLDPEL